MATAGDRRGTGPERAFLAPLPPGGEVTLSREESHHLVRVRRAAVGDDLVLFDGEGSLRRARLIGNDARGAVCEVLEVYPARDPRPLTLAVSLPEPAAADVMVATLAELGVETLLPIVCDRTPSGRADLAARRSSRWARLAREALKVNGCSRPLRVLPGRSLGEALAEAPRGLVLLDPDPLIPCLGAILTVEQGLPCLLVGPAGGFRASEIEAAGRAGARRARLGPPALRTGTAAVAAAAVALCVER